MGKVPEDLAAPLADDYQATLLLNDAYAALEKGDHATVVAKLAEVEKLTRVSPGIGTQVAEMRSKLAAKVSPASQPTTSPK